MRGIDASDFHDVLEWAKEFSAFSNARDYLPFYTRFSIGIYQVTQGMAWYEAPKECLSAYESFAAACVHFVGAASLMDAEHTVWALCPADLLDSPLTERLDARHLLLGIGKAQQMVVYKIRQDTSRGRSRYKSEVMGTSVGGLLQHLVHLIPRPHRRAAFRTAMDIMTGNL